MKKADAWGESREIEGVEQTVRRLGPVADGNVLGKVSAWDIVDMETGEVLVSVTKS